MNKNLRNQIDRLKKSFFQDVTKLSQTNNPASFSEHSTGVCHQALEELLLEDKVQIDVQHFSIMKIRLQLKNWHHCKLELNDKIREVLFGKNPDHKERHHDYIIVNVYGEQEEMGVCDLQVYWKQYDLTDLIEENFGEDFLMGIFEKAQSNHHDNWTRENGLDEEGHDDFPLTSEDEQKEIDFLNTQMQNKGRTK